MTNSRQAQLIVHRGADNPSQYVWSPFVTKIEFRLRLAGLSYTCGVQGPASGPKGKIPWIELSTAEHEPEVLSDSYLIPKALIKKGLAHDLNEPLSAKEKGHDIAIRALLEDKLFFYNVRERWIGNFITMRDYTMAKIPMPQRVAAGEQAYRANIQKLHDQGTGRFTDDEIHVSRKEIWEGINAMLKDSQKMANSDKCFWVLGSDNPTEADTTVYGFIVSTLIAESGPLSKQLVQTECPAVIEYATRIHLRYFADYEMWS
ncbi:hypothetical protein DE146DRAFT_240176 [Phaeosphaeria sp. MPI-PUGE-AT-0046c]|nr:hypothetical protein DE146DRAFT_240176 [Phaeosphaeria sp. MPI-PUGE-AT-0046c]